MTKIEPENDVIYDNDELKSKKKTSGDPSQIKTQFDGASIVMDDETETPEILVKKLKEKIKILEKEKQEYMDGWQRERADFINFKKRTENEKIEVIKYANENLVEELLPVLDSFEMAFANKEAWEKVDKNWRIGVEYIHTQFLKILDENNFKTSNPLGEKFDPKYHVAVEHITTDDESKDGTVIEVKKKGYILNDRVMQPAQVVVGEFKK